MESMFEECVKVAKEKHPKTIDNTIQYGTAGFRKRADELDYVIYRMGLLAVLRSKVKNATIGVMITASHNPEQDNGVKLVDPMGEMMEVSWEKLATTLANASDDDIASVLTKIVDSENIDISLPANVFYARDTRPSSPTLSQALQDGIAAIGGCLYTDFGVLSTPQLHYMVRCHNSKEEYGQPTEEGYYQKLGQAFVKLRGKVVNNGSYTNSIILDGANGVGALKVKAFLKYLNETLHVRICNDGSSGKLNHQCGADFVKVQQRAPVGMTIDPGARGVSFDGDADRIVYFFYKEDGTFNLLDGDKIATLVAGYLKDLVTRSGLQLDLGLVQTAYANGSSTKYITEKLKVPVACVPTGVKHLHHKALEYDVGVYFEANGHGTVLFSDSALQKISKAGKDEALSEEQRENALKLAAVVDLINQTVGDAISDLLLVETILHGRGWGAVEWNGAYTDLPNRQLKVKVKDRAVIQTSDAERRATSPAGLQHAIDTLVKEYNSGRSFVRPSGTEDVVRVYAEADTRDSADQLAYQVAGKVYEMAGGVGDKPQQPPAH